MATTTAHLASSAPESTRERIIAEAMRMFGERGYRGTTIAQIEEAAGLTPGAGGLYHHFENKEALLVAGIERQLARLDALRDIRRVLGTLDDVTAELTLTARYILAELDAEAGLLQIIAAEGRQRPELLNSTIEQLIGSTFTGFAAWLSEHADPPLSDDEAAAVATIGIGALFSSRLTRDILGVPVVVDDERLVNTWVQLMVATLAGSGRARPAS
jgi:AcrR family transcriptional regulator